MKQLLATLALCAACSGCVTAPYIDESIAMLDTNPVPAVSRFGLPSMPPIPISAQPAEMLEGAWNTEIQHPCHRHIGETGVLQNFDKPGKYWHHLWEGYGFNSDGTMVYQKTQGMGTMVISTKERGSWHYAAGKLTLDIRKVETRTSDATLKAMGIQGAEQSFISDVNCSRTLRVVWYAHDEIAIIAEESQTSSSVDSSQKRKEVTVDDYGVKTEREIAVSGMKDGREIGTVSETVYPPMHFRRKE